MKIFLLILYLVLTSGCSVQSVVISRLIFHAKEKQELLLKSPCHSGIIYFKNKRFVGRVSNKSAEYAQAVIIKFNNHIILRDYHDAYRLFSDELKSEISYEVFLNGLKSLDKKYGKEYVFTMKDNPLTEKFLINRKIFFADSLEYYDAVISRYESKRRRNIIFNFGVTRNIRGQLKICFYGYAAPDGEISVTYSAIVRKGNATEEDIIKLIAFEEGSTIE